MAKCTICGDDYKVDERCPHCGRPICKYCWDGKTYCTCGKKHKEK